MVNSNVINIGSNICNKRRLLLWENPDPTKSFTDSHIAIQTDGFKLLEVVTHDTKSALYTTVNIIVNDPNISYEQTITSSIKFYIRYCTVDESGINISKAENITDRTYTTGILVVPYRIYGIR